MSGTRTLAADSLGAVGYGTGIEPWTELVCLGHPMCAQLRLGSGEFGGWVDNLKTCQAPCAVVCGALGVLFLHGIGFSVGSDWTGRPLVNAGMVKPWVKITLPAVYRYRIENEC